MQYKQSWEDMYEFKGVHLIDSLVLFWNIKEDAFSIKADLPYERNNKNHLDALIKGIFDFKRTTITFKGYKKITGLIDITNVTPKIEEGEKIYGNIDDVTRTKDGYEISGIFGDVVITGGEMCLQVHA